MKQFKRITYLVLAFILGWIIVGCKKEVVKTESEKLNEEIQALSDVVDDDTEAVLRKINEKYNALTEEEKEKVDYSKVERLIKSVDAYKLVKLIDTIPDEITASDKTLIDKCMDTYNKMDQETKEKVTNYNKLLTAKETLVGLVGVNVSFNTNGGMWGKEYFSYFTPSASFKATEYNTGMSTAWGNSLIINAKGQGAAAGLYWDRIYIKYDEKSDLYVVTGVLTVGGKFDSTPDYDYIIGAHDNCTDKASRSALGKYCKIGQEGDIVLISGVDLKNNPAGNYDIQFTIYTEADLSQNLEFLIKNDTTLPVASSRYVTFNGWYKDEKCLGEKVVKIDDTCTTLYAGWKEDVKIERIDVSNPLNKILRFENAQLKWDVFPKNASVTKVIFRSSDENILKINEKGYITAVSEGTVKVSVISFINKQVEYSFDVKVYTPGRIEALYETTSIVEVNKDINILATYHGESNENLIFRSLDPNIASVNNNGIVHGISEGNAQIEISVGETKLVVGVTVVNSIDNLDPLIQYLISTTDFNPINKSITSFGAPSSKGPELSKNPYYNDILGSINKYLFEPLDIVEMIIPKNPDNRPGTVYKKEYVCVHDTGTYTTATGLDFASSMKNSQTSWHYTVANDGIYHTIPDNERAYHAGDGNRTYGLEDTLVKATTSAEDAIITFDSQGYFAINGVSTSLRPYDKNGQIDTRIYKTNQITPMGIRCVIGENGNYFLGKTWYSPDYDYVANYGGNNNSIGIESSVSLGTDYYYTWQKLAKLVAKLVKDNGLTINDVKGHNFFSGKPCPQVILFNDLWDDFIELVKAELEMITTYKDYTVKLTYDTTNLMDKNGRLNRQNITSNVTYTITVTKNGVSHSITLSSMVFGKYSL